MSRIGEKRQVGDSFWEGTSTKPKQSLCPATFCDQTFLQLRLLIDFVTSAEWSMWVRVKIMHLKNWMPWNVKTSTNDIVVSKKSAPEPFERCSKLQLKLNGNYSSLREILAPSLRDHNGSLRAVNFSNWACATLREDEILRFGAFLLARCRHEAGFGLGFLGFSDSRLARLFLSFSTSWLVQWLLDF